MKACGDAVRLPEKLTKTLQRECKQQEADDRERGKLRPDDSEAGAAKEHRLRQVNEVWVMGCIQAGLDVLVHEPTMRHAARQ